MNAKKRFEKLNHLRHGIGYAKAAYRLPMYLSYHSTEEATITFSVPRVGQVTLNLEKVMRWLDDRDASVYFSFEHRVLLFESPDIFCLFKMVFLKPSNA